MEGRDKDNCVVIAVNIYSVLCSRAEKASLPRNSVNKKFARRRERRETRALRGPGPIRSIRSCARHG